MKHLNIIANSLHPMMYSALESFELYELFSIILMMVAFGGT